MLIAFRNSILFTALCILLLHSTVPHQHHSETEDIENHELIEQDSSPLDFLIAMFHEDLGEENHLEDYNVSTNIELSVPFITTEPAFYSFAFAIAEASQSYPPIFKESTLDSIMRPATKKRGPPRLV
ncbi:MAG: hypothetical protein HKP14_02485 [Bacteroidia bacterium]|nr:hypothetical protein [Bacteroidia bacterium]